MVCVIVVSSYLIVAHECKATALAVSVTRDVDVANFSVLLEKLKMPF